MAETNIPSNFCELLEHIKGKNKVERAINLDEYIRQKAWEKGLPIYGKFELTPLCNLDCKMCYVHLNREQMDGAELMSVAQWKNIMKQAIDEGMLYAVLTGGECLTYKGFKELYLYLQSFGIQITVLTNGILVDNNIVDFFVENPPKEIQISVYGSCEEAYERVTGYRHFERVMEAIRLLKEADMPLKLAVTPSKFMVGDEEKIVEMLSEIGVPFMISVGVFDPYENTGRRGKSLEMPEDNYINMLKLKARLMKKMVTDYEGEMPVFIENTGKGISCGAGRLGFVITWKGEMQPCSMFQEIVEYPFKYGFEKCWEKINKFSMEYVMPIECKGCEYRRACFSCAATHRKKALMGHICDEVCQRGKRLVKEGLVRL